MSGPVSRTFHDFVSRRICVPLSYAGRMARPSTRQVYRTFAEGLQFRELASEWSDDRKREWMLRALRRAVRRASRTTTFYSNWFRSAGFEPMVDFSFEDYAQLPVLERSDLRAAGKDAVSTELAPEQLQHDATGGSTGAPTEIWKGPEERGWGESSHEFFMRQIGVPTGSSVAYLWGHHLDPVQRNSVRERVYDWCFNVSWYDCFRLSAETLKRYDGEFRARRPQAIIAYAGALAALGEVTGQSGPLPGYPRTAFVTGAEKLFPHQRNIIEQAYGRPVHERYGSRDAGIIGFQTRPWETHAFEVDWANILVEPVDDAGVTDILVTKLHADGMPMLRYRIGDIGRFPAGVRAGTPALRIDEVVGRDVSRLWLPDGRWVHGLSIPHLMKGYPVREFQLVQKPDLAIEVRIIPTEGYREEHGRELTGVIQDNVPGLPISLHIVDEIPRTRAGKWNPVVSEAQPATASR